MEENTNTTEQLRLLLVEDEPFLRDLLSMKFGGEQVTVLHAHEEAQILQLAQDEQPDAILLDLVLPGTSGFDVLEKLTANEATQNIPVIILSNLGQDEDVKRGLAMGAKEFLIKAHSSPGAIINKVRAVVTQAQS